MTKVIISPTYANIVISEQGQSKIVLTVPAQPRIVLSSPGMAGPPGPAGLELDDTARVDKSVIYYDAASSTYRADGAWTLNTLTDGGNF